MPHGERHPSRDGAFRKTRSHPLGEHKFHPDLLGGLAQDDVDLVPSFFSTRKPKMPIGSKVGHDSLGLAPLADSVPRG